MPWSTSRRFRWAEHHLTKRVAIVAGVCGASVVILVGIFASVGIAYRGGFDSHALGHCVFDVETCSVAAATWALFFGTAGAFVAAALAAVFAAAIYGLEVERQLGQSPCRDPAHRDISDIVFILPDDRNPLDAVPTNFPEESYTRLDHEFRNLGRLPLTTVCVSATATFPKQGQPFPFTAYLGNIAVEQQVVHLTTYFSDKFGIPTISWHVEAATSGGQKIKFHPAPEQRGRMFIYSDEVEATTDEEVDALVDALADRIAERLSKKSSTGPPAPP